MKENIEQLINLLNDLKGATSLLNRYSKTLNINKEDYLYTFIQSYPSVADVDDAIFVLKERIEKLSREKLYVITTTLEEEIKVEEVKVRKYTDKLFKVDCMGYNQVNKNELNIIKEKDDMIFLFTTDIQQGKEIIINAIHSKIETIKNQLGKYTNVLSQLKGLE